jgi:hypothetical protein
MSMTKNYVVHGPHFTPMSKAVWLNKELVNATVQGFECELVATDGHSGTVKMRAVGAEAKDAQDLFVNGNTVAVTFAKV